MTNISPILAHGEPVLHWHLGDLVLFLPAVLAVGMGIGAFLFRRKLRCWLGGASEITRR